MTDHVRPRVIGLTIDPDEVLPPDRYRFGPPLGRAERVLALAAGLASSPLWDEMPDTVLVVRVEPPEGFAFVGVFRDEHVTRLESLPGALRSIRDRFRYITWEQVEHDCERLAARLVEEFGRSEVRDMAFTAIPRGGLVVLGILAYALGLPRGRLTDGPTDDAPLVVVDDCALTGLRFGEFLRGRAEDRVVFAHLYSHPDLRSAILAREPRVIAAPVARDLEDFAPDLLGDEHRDWTDRWLRRASDRSYWVGRPERLCFPWSEPDSTIWNPVLDREEVGWKLVPPAACLKNRRGGESGRPRLQIQPLGSGPLRAAGRTFHCELDGGIVVASLDRGRVLRLDGLAAAMWRAIIENGEVRAAARALGGELGEDPAELEHELAAFVSDMERKGLLADGRRSGGGRDAT